MDRTAKTCTCTSFLSGEHHCRHLEELGVYRQKQFTPGTHPTFSQALSGLVKSIRMRRASDAVYWLVYLDQFKPTEKLSRKGMRFRVARRILIGSAEDGHSISVMESVASNFQNLCKLDTPMVDLAAKIVQICKLPNWWDPETGGHDYIYNSLVGHRRHVLYRPVADSDAAWLLLRKAVDQCDRSTALGALFLLGALRVGSTKQAEFLTPIARQMNHENAVRLLNIHLGARSALSGDNNFIAQAVWMMTGGVSPIADQIEPVELAEAHDLLDKARERWKDPEPIPNCYCDGIHCAGNDRRYAGILSDMWAVCMAFQHYGNIEPENEWLPEFFPIWGLQAEEVE